MEEVGYSRQVLCSDKYFIEESSRLQVIGHHYSFPCNNIELGNYNYPNVKCLKERLSKYSNFN